MQQPHFGSQISQAYSVYVSPYGMRRLSPAFQPGSFDVLCARGKLAYDHEGNKRFRALVKQHQKAYSAASCKYEKSKIVSFIVSAVRNASPQGGFVKNIDGSWFEVGDRHAKEKVGQTFRDLLHNKYSSSTKAKARARLQKRMKGEPEQQEEGGGKAKPQQKARKQQPNKKKQPEAVPSGTNSDDLRSSVSVVSENSMETDEAGNTSSPHRSSRMSEEMPPLRSVVVKKGSKKQQQLQQLQQIVTPPQSQRLASLNLMDTLHSGMEALDGRDSGSSPRPPFLRHPGAPAAAGASASAAGRPPMMDMEPLPLGQAPSMKVDFNESNSSIQSEQSFEDVMSEFYQNMSVPV